MVKKILLTTALMLTGIIMVNAQCTPNLSCASLICPDTTINLPHAQPWVLYSTTMTIIAPHDTTLAGIGLVTIDTIKCTSITGLPTGFTATPDKIAGWPGGSAGCLLITGTTNNANEGTHSLVINTSIKVEFGGTPITLPIPLNGYKIIVDSTNGISTSNLIKFSLSQNSPNPFALKTNIEFTSAVSEVLKFTVYDVIGNIVYNQLISAKVGLNNFDFSTGNLSSGIYIYKLSNNKESFTRRMIVANK